MSIDRMGKFPARIRRALDRAGRIRRVARRPWAEALESRLVLSTLTVTTTNDDPFTPSDVNAMGQLSNHGGEVTLRSAIFANNASGGGDEIDVPAGTYRLTILGIENDDLAGDLDVTAAVSIVGAGAGTVVEAGSSASNGIDRVFDINPQGASAGFAASISGLTIQFGRNPVLNGSAAGEGGGLSFNAGTGGSGSLTLDGVIVDQNSTLNGDGGGVALLGGGTVLIENSQIEGNLAGSLFGRHSSDGGGVYLAPGGSGSLTIADSSIDGNTASGDGGGLFAGSATTIQASDIDGNSAYFGGGLFSKNSSGFSVVGSRIVGNSSTTGASATAGRLGLGNSDVANNWFGANAPSSKLFALGIVPTHLVLTLSASPITFAQGNSTTLTASITTNSIAQGGFSVPDGTPVTFGSSADAPNPTSTTTTGGVASATLTPSSPGTVTVSATVDGQTLTLPVYADVAPIVTLNPVNATATLGQSVTFTAAASGSPIPSAQWQVSTDGGSSYSNVFGATATTYTFVPTASQTGNLYRAVFSNALGSVSTSAATLTVPSPPVVTSNPTNQGAFVGNTVTFTASAFGTPTPTVQWQVSTNGVSFSNIGGATSASYSFTATSGANGDSYRAVFTNGLGSATTTAATLTVAAAPAITGNPTSQSVSAGAVVTFSASATGNPTPSIQWQKSTDGGSTFSNIARATSATYSLTATSQLSGNEYRAVFTNAAGTATTNAATLTVTTAPIVTNNPASRTVALGNSVTFSASASGNPAPTVQWQVSTNGGSSYSNISGATSTNYTFTPTLGQSGNLYRAVFTNAFGSASTTGATLTVETPPTISTNPTNQTVTAGQMATFTAASGGSTPQTVQWQVSTDGGSTFSSIPGATSASYSFTTTASQNGDVFRAVFVNAVGTAFTSNATLTVQTPPMITSDPSDQSVSPGDSASFSASASGNPSPTVQWQVSTDGGMTFTNISGATSTTYTFTTAAGDNGNQYQAVFTNVVSTATTTAATLTVS